MTSQTTPPPDPVITQAEAVVKAIEAVLVPIAETAIEQAVPALGVPVVKQIVDAIVKGLADKLTQLAETGVAFTIIDTETAIENWSMSDALKALMSAIASKNQEAINAATQAYLAAQQALVTASGSSSPIQ